MQNYKEPLDAYDMKPREMTAYLRHNGWHFNKKSLQFATENMRKDGQPLEAWTKDEVAAMLNQHGIQLKEPLNYDHVFVANMAKADFYGSSLPDEESVAKFVKDYAEDEDQADGFIFNRYYADSVRSGQRIPWEDLL